MLKVAWNSHYRHPLPAGHRFPMEKYDLLPEQLLYEGTLSHDNFFDPDPAPLEDVLRCHDTHYWHKLDSLQLSRSEERKTGFPLSASLVHRERVIMQGTVQAALFALQHGAAMNVAGGTHHAYADRGEGFCLLNDIAIAAHHLLAHDLVHQVLVIDLDVHQGNGTAAIMANEPRVFTFSMHGEKNYPLHKERSDLDVALPDGTGDKEYLHLLDRHLGQLLDSVQPDFLFFQSGVDVLAQDKLGRLGLSVEGCRQRDKMVWSAAKRHGLPIVASMGGGYAAKISDIVTAHANTYRLAQEIFF